MEYFLCISPWSLSLYLSSEWSLINLSDKVEIGFVVCQMKHMHLWSDQRLSNATTSGIPSIRLVLFKHVIKIFRVLYFFIQQSLPFYGALNNTCDHDQIIILDKQIITRRIDLVGL